MSEESTTPDLKELTRRVFEALNGRDFDALMRFVANDGVLDSRPTIGIVTTGPAAISGFLEDWFRAYEELEYMLESLHDLGKGVLFAVVSQKARPVGVTGDLRQREGWIFVWVDDLMASVRTHPEADIDEARAAAERLAEERG
jgi:ketosteroid isomerase-like protein